MSYGIDVRSDSSCANHFPIQSPLIVACIENHRFVPCLCLSLSLMQYCHLMTLNQLDVDKSSTFFMLELPGLCNGELISSQQTEAIFNVSYMNCMHNHHLLPVIEYDHSYKISKVFLSRYLCILANLKQYILDIFVILSFIKVLYSLCLCMLYVVHCCLK